MFVTGKNFPKATHDSDICDEDVMTSSHENEARDYDVTQDTWRHENGGLEEQTVTTAAATERDEEEGEEEAEYVNFSYT